MKFLKLSLFVALAILVVRSNAMAQSIPQNKADFHLYLLAGQSNMAGRGEIEESDLKPHPRVLALNKEGEWVPAVAPIHFDKPVAGVGLGKSFGVALAESDKSIVIGLIPAACGGSPIESWEPGGYHSQTESHPYDDALKRARLAMESGMLKGVLWHQGESDSSPERAPQYEARLEGLINRLRNELNLPDLPFLIGQLGQFNESPWTEPKRVVNEAHIAVSKKIPRVVFVSSDGLSCKSDHIHFDSASLRTFGKRYAAAYQEMGSH